MLTTDYYSVKTETFVVSVGAILDIQLVDQTWYHHVFIFNFSNLTKFFININFEYSILIFDVCVHTLNTTILPYVVIIDIPFVKNIVYSQVNDDFNYI